MNNMIEIKPVNSQKSFYGKAYAIESNNCITLYSYKTAVCKIVNGQLVKLWNKPAYDEKTGRPINMYSRTTMNHISAFCAKYGIIAPNKKQWDNM